MTMLSFRVDSRRANATEEWAKALGIDRSELLRDALDRYLAALRGEDDAASWEAEPLTDSERILAGIADWGPAEDWADWTDATR